MTEQTVGSVPRIRFKGFDQAWAPKKLGQVYTERNERGNDSLPILSVSIHTGISSGELSAEGLGKKVRRSDDKSLYKHVRSGDLVLNMMRAWQGALGVAVNEGMVSPAYLTATPDDSVYPLFMDCALRRPQIVARMNSLSYGVTDFRKRLYWDSFVRVELPLPSVPEQQKIAAHFTCLDSVIELHERKYAKLSTLWRAMLERMFPKSGTAVPDLRFGGFSGSWTKVKLKEIGTFKRGISYSQEDVTNSGLLVLRSGNIQNGRLIFDSDLQFINKECPDEIRLRKGDIAICMSNGSKALVGKSAICMADPISPTTVGAFCSIFRSVSPIAAPLLQTIQYQRYVSDLLAGSSINNIKGSDLCELEFRVPGDIGEQEKVGDYFRILQDLIRWHEIQIQKLREIKSAYQQSLFI